MDNRTTNGEIRNLKTQIVIIGGGGAGMAAAVAAAEKGIKNIIVLEKRGATGGSSAMALGPFAADSVAQRRQGIIVNKDELFKKAMNWAHMKVNARLVRAFIDKSGDTIRWLEEKGLYFECQAHSPIDNPMTWHIPRGRGAEIMNALAKDCKRFGVQVLTRTHAKKLLVGKESNVIGVIAEREGREFTIKAQNTIIATGGYSGNKELLKKYCPSWVDKVQFYGIPNTGDGLIMAMEIGAATEGLGMVMHSTSLSPRERPMRAGDAFSGVNRSIGRQPFTPWVNKRGKRFIDEGAVFYQYEVSNAVVRQPDNLYFSLFDKNILQTMSDQGFIMNQPVVQPREGPWKPLYVGMDNWLRTNEENGWVKIADSWDEIADWMGADRKVLKASIAEYNYFCDKGHDDLFAKEQRYLLPLRDPPHYAIRCSTSSPNTVGGIKINENMEVLDLQDNPIRGLYAVGVDTGGWTSDTYCVSMPGTAFGFALNSGRIAGEHSASKLS
jgi:fumarate reductase flavoprotein subunit